MMDTTKCLVGAVAFLASSISLSAAIIVETVHVGNQGNTGEPSGVSAPGGFGPDRTCGAVAYVFDMGKFEVTAAQYTAFLNAVAATDTYDLYSTSMWDTGTGAKIQRHGASGSYTYTVADDYASRPVNYVSWGDAVRFANWMHNGQPTGAQGANTTEDGSYHINGAMTKAALAAVTRKTGETWVIPSEDEWYKSAYHKKDGVTGNYWDYPTGSDTVPSNVYDAKWDPSNNANFDSNGYTIGEPYFRTPVGEFEHSDSAYGTFDQGGNLYEWNEAIFYPPPRRVGATAYPIRFSDRRDATNP